MTTMSAKAPRSGLFARIQAHALQSPERDALCSGDECISYAALWSQIQAHADALQGIQCLALLGDNSPEWVCMDLAARFAGLCVLPIPPFFTEAQVQYAVQVAQVDALWASTPLPMHGKQESFAQGYLMRREAGARVLPADIAKLTFTSGTTGTPKGVALTQAAMEAVVQSLDQVLALGAAHIHLSILPLAVLLENLAGVDLTLWMGGSVRLPSLAAVGMQGSSRFDAAQFSHALQQYSPHSLILTPQLLQALVTVATHHPALKYSLRFIAVGGASVSPHLLHQADALGLPVYEGYGLSEMSSVVSLNAPKARRIGSVGRPLPHIKIDFHTEQQEIMLRGPSLFSGYLDETEGFISSVPVFASGDQGSLDADGFLHLEGRIKHQFITAYGRNVSPEWVERELILESEIQQAVVVGEARSQNLGLLVAHPETPAAALDAAVERANSRLPDYAQVHHWIGMEAAFTVENGLWTGTGRPRRAEIERQYREEIEQAYLQNGTQDLDDLALRNG